MADEPILCFDGDKAGQRAAFRAVDMAMPRLKPGKSVTNAQGLPTMTLTLGKDFKDAGEPLTAASKAPDVDKSTADKVECAK